MKRLFCLILAVLMITGTLAITAFAADAVYSDVKEGKWFYDAVMEAYEKELMFGSDGKFRPNDTMNRAEMVTLISRLAGVDLDGYKVSKKFKDVGMTSWYTPVVCWASDEGLVGGYEDRTFKPTAPVKRQELAKMIVGLIDYIGADIPDAEDAAEPFKDFSKIQSWAKDYVEALRKTGLVKGDDKGNFNPLKTASRAEVATIAVRLNAAKNTELTPQQIVDKFADGVCDLHNRYYVTMGYGSEYTLENFEKYMPEWMGLDTDKFAVEIDPEGIEDSLEGYQGQGFGSSENATLSIRVSNKETGETSEWTDIDFCVTKYPDGPGVKLPCPEDGTLDNIIENLTDYFDLDDAGRIKIALGAGSTFTRENISEIVMTAVGLDPRVFAFVITDEGEDTFKHVKSTHGGLCHGQVHDAYFKVCIEHLPDTLWLTSDKGVETHAYSKLVDHEFWFSKSLDAMYHDGVPADGTEIAYKGEETKEEFDEVIKSVIVESDDLCEDFTVYDYDFDAIYDALNGGSDSVEFHVTFILPTDDFPEGNQAELSDTVVERDFKAVVAD